MSLWLILAAMTALALGLAVAPLLRRARATSTRREHNLSVYRAQLEELRAERERGLLGDREAQAAELEVKRRMLAAEDENEAGLPAGATAARIVTAAAILIALPALSAAIYWQLGSPGLPSRPFAEREGERRQVAGEQQGSMQGQSVPPVATMIARLEERVQDNPDDLEGWFRLGRAFQLNDQPGRAAEAYEQALALEDDIPELHAALAESAITAADGIVTAKAQQALERALELDPANARARFYQGLALVQRGERERALGVWSDLITDTPADAPWLPALRQRVTALAEDLGRDVDEVLPEPAPAAAVAAGGDDGLPGDAAGLRAEAQRLADALDREPEDWQGWIRLARVRAALGEKGEATAALAEGAKVYADAPFVQQQFAAAAADLGVEPPATPDGPRGPTSDQMQAAAEMSPEAREDMIRGMVEGLAARLEEQPDDVAGWRMLARSYGVLGEEAKAAEAAKEVARLLPEDPAAQIGYAQALLALEHDDAPLSPEVVEQWRRVVALDQDNPEALFFLGRAAVERGEVDRAEQYWQRLLARIPEDAPQRDQVERLIDQLRAGN